MKRKLISCLLVALICIGTIAVPSSMAANYKFVDLTHADVGQVCHTASTKPQSGNWTVKISTFDYAASGSGLFVNAYKHVKSGDTVMGNGFWITNTQSHSNTWKTTPNATDEYCLFGRLDQSVSGPKNTISGIWAP